MENIVYKVLEMPLPESLLSGVKPIKVKNPDRDKFYEELRISYSLKSSRYLDKNIDDQIEYNDVVELSSESINKKFNSESLWITVGRNAFDTDFEKEIIGIKANEERTFKIGDDYVHVKIKSITKKYYGDISLDDIRKDFPKTDSIESFFKQTYDRKCAELSHDKVNTLLIPKLFSKLLEKAKIEFDENSLKQYIDNQVKEAGIAFIPEGISEEDKKHFIKTPIEAKIDRLEYMDMHLDMFKSQRTQNEYKNLSPEDIDQTLADKIKEELYYKIVNKEFAKSVGYTAPIEDYNKMISEQTQHSDITAEEFIKKTGYTFEIYTEWQNEHFAYSYFLNYALENLVKN